MDINMLRALQSSFLSAPCNFHCLLPKEIFTHGLLSTHPFQLLIITHLFFVFKNLPIEDISCKWNHTILYVQVFTMTVKPSSLISILFPAAECHLTYFFKSFRIDWPLTLSLPDTVSGDFSIAYQYCFLIFHHNVSGVNVAKFVRTIYWHPQI